MRVTKKITFSEIGDGYIHVADVTTNCPTVISAWYALVTTFSSSGENPTIAGTLKFDPVSGNDRTQSFSMGEATSKDYAQEITGTSSFFTQVNGELLIEAHRLGGDTPAPTAGEFILIVEIESVPAS